MQQCILKKIKGTAAVLCTDTVAEEVRLRLVCGEAVSTEFYCLPADYEALALGYLFAEGYVKSAGEVAFSGPAVCGADGLFTLTAAPVRPLPACGRALETVCGIGRGDLLLQGEIHWDRAMGYAGALLQASELFRSTGCIHAAALCKGGELCFTGEDISRFYALYKALGKALLAGEDVGAYVLCTTGRLPAPYMERVIRSGIGCVVSRSAPTALSLGLARRYGVTAFGFAGAEKLSYYPAPLGCCLLAGGDGSRADGADKALLTCGGKTFAQRILSALSPEGERLISYNRNPEALEALLGDFAPVTFVRDDEPGLGPLGGILSALRRCESGAVLFAPCDLPFYTAAAANACRAAFTGLEDAVVLTAGGRLQPLCGIYAKACVPVLERMALEKRCRMRDVLAALRVTYVDAAKAGLDQKQFMNINTWREYEMIG